MIQFEPVPDDFMKSEEYRNAVRTVAHMLIYEKVIDVSYDDVNLETLLG